MSNMQMNINQIKRQSSFTELFNWEIKKLISKQCLASNDFITSMEDLPNEIFL